MADELDPGDDLVELWPDCHIADPESLPVPFHRGQQLAWDSDFDVTAMIAGTQGGKTIFGPWWLNREIERMGAGDYLAATATYDLFKLRMLPALLQVFVHILKVGRYWPGDRLIEIKDPLTGRFRAKRSTDPMYARIILRSLDSIGGLEAATAKAAWLDEAGQDRVKLTAYQAVERRLAIHEGKQLITTTLYNLGWLKNQVIDEATEGGEQTEELYDNGAELTLTDNADHDIRLIQYDSILNPAYPKKRFEKAQRTTAKDEFAMYWRGLVAKLRTLIYDCFDDDVNKVPPFKLPGHWPRLVGIDPVGAYIGVVWLAFDPDTANLYLYRESLEPFGITTSQHAENVRQNSKGENVIAFVVGQPAERQPRIDWQGAGIPARVPPFSSVWSGINRIYELITTDRFFVFDTCTSWLDEAGKYQRKKNSSGDLTTNIKDKDQYHLMDATRYIIAWASEPQETEELVKLEQPIGPKY